MMRALIFHGSSVIGLLVLLNQLWQAAEIVRAVVTAFITGLVVYVVLMVGYVALQHLLAQVSASSVEAAPGAGPTPAGDSAAAPAQQEHASGS